MGRYTLTICHHIKTNIRGHRPLQFVVPGSQKFPAKTNTFPRQSYMLSEASRHYTLQNLINQGQLVITVIIPLGTGMINQIEIKPFLAEMQKGILRS